MPVDLVRNFADLHKLDTNTKGSPGRVLMFPEKRKTHLENVSSRCRISGASARLRRPILQRLSVTSQVKMHTGRFRDIVILSQYYLPESGAPAVRLSQMAKELQALGVRVRVITGMPNYPVGRIYDGYRGKMRDSEIIDGVPVHRVWLYPATGKKKIKRLASYLSFTATSIWPLLRASSPDLVFVEAQPVTLALVGLLSKWFRGIPFVYNTPDLQVEYADEDRWLGFRALLHGARKLETYLMRKSFSVTTVTHAFIKHFHEERGVPMSKLSFLPNGADVERLRPLPVDEAYARKMGVEGKTVFTYAGTMAPYQGLEVLVDVAEILQHRKDIVILMVGRGPVRDTLIAEKERRQLDNLVFRESPFEEMHQLLSISFASLVVLRPLGIAKKMRLSKAIPPLACGIPVLYAGWGETADIIEREQVGLKLEPDRPDLLAEAMVHLADNRQERDEMGKRGRLLAERDFSWSFIVSDWLRQVEAIAVGEDPKVPGLS